MAVPSASTKLPSVAPVEVEVAAALVVVEATTQEVEGGIVEDQVDIVRIGSVALLIPANMRRRRWRWVWWWT